MVLMMTTAARRNSHTHVVYGYKPLEPTTGDPWIAGFGKSDRAALDDARRKAGNVPMVFYYVRSNGDRVRVNEHPTDALCWGTPIVTGPAGSARCDYTERSTSGGRACERRCTKPAGHEGSHNFNAWVLS